MRTITIALGLTCAALSLGCGDSKTIDPVEVLPPVALEGHVAWIDTSGDQILMLDVGASRPEAVTERHELPKNPFAVERRHEANELLVLSSGAEDDAGSLSVVGEKGVLRSYELGAKFDRLVQSDDGRYAFLHFSPNGGVDSTLLFNPNEVAIIDLDKKGQDAVTPRTLRSFGGTPQQVMFSPELDLADETRRLAVVLFGSQIALLDLQHLDRPEYTIELSRNQIQLNQVRFSAEENRVYLLGNRSQDIYVINLFPAGENRQNDFEPSLNQLGAGAQPTDMALYGDKEDRRLLALSGGQALVIEASSNRVTSIPLDTTAQSILLYEGSSPFDDKLEQRALLYGTSGSAVSFLDLEEVEERTTRNLEVVQVGGRIKSATPLSGGDLLLVLENNGLSVLNLESRTPSRISAQLPLEAAIPDVEGGRIWVAPSGASSLGFLSLDQFQTGQVRLDDPIESLLLVPSGKQKLAVVTHNSGGGKVTLVDGKDPKNTDKMVTLEGFFYSDLLDR